MDLFFKRDCADGAGPAVEPANPLLAASLDALAPPGVVAAVAVVAEVVDVGGWEAGAAGLLPRPKIEEGAAALDVAVAELAGVPAPPAPLVVVVVAAGAAPLVVEKERSPVVPIPEPPEAGFLGANKPVDALGGAGLAGVPPKPRMVPEEVLGCDEAGGAGAGVVPSPNDGALLAGVDAGVVLLRLENRVGVDCAPCVPDWAAPPKRVEGVVDGCAVVLLFTSDCASVLPKNESPEPPVAPPGGLGVADAEGVVPNRFDVEDAEVVAGLLRPENRDEVPELAPVPVPDWDGWAPNKLVPGGGPAGVVEGREMVFVGAGVAAGVEEGVDDPTS